VKHLLLAAARHRLGQPVVPSYPRSIESVARDERPPMDA
jgi:hypothetical protein